MTSRALLAILLSLAAASSRLTAQAPDSTVRLRGMVRSIDGMPIEGANVFVIETLDGALSAADGRFAIVTRGSGALTLVVRRLGFGEERREILPGRRDSIVVTLTAGAVALSTITVRAGEYTASSERGATLTPLEVVTTPGTAADVNRAIQALPGVQSMDEGTGLFVRGGDFTETRVFLNDAGVLNPVQLQQPSGTFIGTVDPFLLDGIFFSSGGFGARYGDALSGIASLRTLARPTRSSVTASAGLAALSASAALALPRGLGVRAAANVTHLEPLFRVNGSTRRFDPPPHGRDLSGTATWTYGGSGEVKLFSIDQTNSLGIGVDDPSYSGAFDHEIGSGLTVLSWKDLRGSFAPKLSLSTTRMRRVESFGAFRLLTRLRQRQMFGETAWELAERVTLRAGGEVERVVSQFEGSIPDEGDDVKPGARVTVIGSEHAGTRTALFGEADWHLGARARLVTGLRSDRSTLTSDRTIDPRLSAAYRLRGGATLTAAWGVYHQVPDPLLFDPAVGDPSLESMRATQSVLGVQVGGDDAQARIELYDKRYTDLAQQTRDFDARAGGRGRARGADVFLKGVGPVGLTGRLVYSFVSARRTDPETGLDARAPFDVTHTLTVVAERAWGPGWRTAVAWRHATGRPFTPVTGATVDAARAVWAPIHGAPMSERHPDFRRLDLSASRVMRVGSAQVVGFVALSNVLDRVNVQAYRYSPDYSERIPIRSIFNRSVYFGATVTLLRAA